MKVTNINESLPAFNIFTTGTETTHSVQAHSPREALEKLQHLLNDEQYDRHAYISETTLGNLMLVHNGKTYWTKATPIVAKKRIMV